MSDYTAIQLTDAPDVLGDYPGEMRFLTGPLEAEQAALTWRRMPPSTGGRGSYGHRHKTQEELYLVVEGTLTFKVGDDVFEAPSGTAVRVAPDALRSVHNDSDADVVLVITSVIAADYDGEIETEDGFWPS
ncbi:MAG: cupin domain-containing protein [Actinomycetota bacterium]|nr:cupin domain-containing protein [Actinomycetota bacterium]